MTILPPPSESAASKKLVDEVLEKTDLSSYSSIPVDFPVHVHEKSGEPNLSAKAIHLFPDGFDDERAHIDDPDCGDNRTSVFGGDVNCRSLYTGNWMGIGGKLRSKVVHGHSGCNTGVVANSIEAILVLEQGHSFIADDELKAEAVYTEHNMLDDPGDGSIAHFADNAVELFQKQFLLPIKGYEDEYEVDFAGVTKAILNGQPWRRDS